MIVRKESGFTCELGRIVDDERKGTAARSVLDDRVFRLTDSQWATHCAIIGPTGAGKSRTMWQMMREHRRQRRGFCVIDPGDLAADFLADCAAEVLLNGNYALLKRLYWIKLNPYRMPRYDAFNWKIPEGIHPEMRHGIEVCRRHLRVQQIMQVTQANVTGGTDFMNQPRRQRVLNNVFTALATAVEGRHLAMEDVFIFFNPAHPRWRQVLDRCVPHIPDEVRQELEMLGGFKRIQDLLVQVESSINSCRAMLGPCMKAMLSATGQEPSFSWDEAVQRGGYVIVDVQDGEAAHAENVALATLMALDLGETMLNTPKHKRKSFTLFVDEAAEFLGPLGREFGRWLRIMRKYGMPCCLGFQDLASMQREDLDLTPVILGQCGTILSFRSRWPQDNDILARVLMTGNLEFEPLIHDVYQQRGDYEWLRIQEVSKTIKHDVSHSASHGSMQSVGDMRSATNAHTRQASELTGSAETKVYGPMGLFASVAKAKNQGNGTTIGDSAAEATGSQITAGTTESATEGSTVGWAVSVGEKLLPLPIVVHDRQMTGQLQKSASDQHEKNRQRVHELGDRHVIAIAPGMKKAVEIVTMDVPDPFQSLDAQAKAVKWIEGKICETHDFYCVPSFDTATQEARIEEFLGNHRKNGHSPTRTNQESETPGKTGNLRGADLSTTLGKKNPLPD